MNCIRWATPNVLHYGALHFSTDYLATVDSVSNIVHRDIADSGLTLQDFKDCNVVLDFRGEGQCDKVIVNLITYLKSIPVKGLSAIFNTDIDVKLLDYPAVSVVDHLANFSQWFDNLKQHSLIWETECNFLSLNRRPSVSRAKLASRLLGVTKSIRISFGSMCETSELGEYTHWFNSTPLPLLLDGKIIRGTDSQEHSAINPLFRTCAVNIIAESSCQHDPNVWRSVFVTEKTFKAFGMLQFPIWWAVPGLVSCVRRMGFDVFDDLIDHGYDLEQDEDRRLDLIIKEITKLDKINLGQLRYQYQDRLLSNWKLVDRISCNQHGQFSRILKNLNLDTQV